MVFRRLGALAAALSIAFVPMVSRAAETASAPTPGMTDTVIDAQAQMDALKDIPANSWAYQAIVDLVHDGIIVGYPDGTFKGARPLTRYEAAVLVERAVQYLTKKLGSPQAAEVTQADIDKLRALLDEFKGDIDSLKLRVSDIDDRLKKVEATQDRAKIGLIYFIRPGNFQDQVSAYTANGAPTPPNVVLTPSSGNTTTGPGGNASQNRYITGNTGNGYGYQLLRVLLDGNIDKRTSYHIRVESVYNWDTSDAFQNGGLQGPSTASCTTAVVTAGTGCALASGSNGSGPGGAATLTPNFAGSSYPRSAGIRFNYGYLQYDDPSGLRLEAGRINETDGTLGLAWGDQFNGGLVGYVKGPVNVRAGYFFDYPALNNIAGVSNTLSNTTCKGGVNINPITGATTVTNTTNGATGANGVTQPSACGVTTQTILANFQYQVTPKFLIGAAYEDDINSVVSTWDPSVCAVAGSGQQCSTANYLSVCPTYLVPGSPACQPYGLYEPSIINVSVASAFGRYADPNLISKGAGIQLEGEGLIRLGNDPFTGTGWNQNLAYWLQGKLGHYNATPFTAYLEGGYANVGFNSVNSHTNLESGPFYEGQYLGNVNGYQIGYVGLHYWFSTYGRVGLVYNTYDLRSGTTLPVSSTACPGCFLTHDYGQGLFLQTYLQF
jgi:hypothetical protein